MIAENPTAAMTGPQKSHPSGTKPWPEAKKPIIENHLRPRPAPYFILSPGLGGGSRLPDDCSHLRCDQMELALEHRGRLALAGPPGALDNWGVKAWQMGLLVIGAFVVLQLLLIVAMAVLSDPEIP